MDPEHREQRRSGIGSSDIAKIIGISPWGGPLDVYLDKLGVLPERENEPMRWGTMLEDVIARAYAETTGREVYPPLNRVTVHPIHPWIIASIDRDSVGAEGKRVLECKTSRYGSGFGEDGSTIVPDYYAVQVQWQLYCDDGYESADLACLIGGQDFRVYHLERDEPVIAFLASVAREFWRRVELRDPPAFDWSMDRALELHNLLVRPDPAKSIQLGDESLAAANLYRNCVKLSGRIDAEKERAKIAMLQLIGDAGVATLPDGRTITRKRIISPPKMSNGRDYIDFRITEPKRGLIDGSRG